jgi:hypothetical protein
MALVSQLEKQSLDRDAEHQPVKCTYTVVRNALGEAFIQLDTYGSSKRKIQGEKSQSIRFTAQALQQLFAVAKENHII